MSNSQLSAVVRYLRNKIAAAAEPDGTTDGQLLERFVRQRDESAFEVLMRRHGPMVLGICQRLLRDRHDAEDAFQATFLVLVRKAGSIGKRESVGSWLARIAYRTAVKAVGEAARRRARQSPLMDLPAADAIDDLAWQELRPVLDEELNRLSEKHRAPVVLCYLQEKTYAEAAQVLGLAEGTVSSRLARARDLLRKRLSRRGLGLSSGLLVTLLSRNALSAAMPVALLDATTKAAMRCAAGKAAAAGAVSAQAAALMEGVLRAMSMTRLRMAALVLLTVGLLGTAAGALLHRALGEQQANARKEAAPKAVARQAAKPQGNNQPAPEKAFENAFGYSWLAAPTEPGVAAGGYKVWVHNRDYVCTFAVGKQGELLIGVASATPAGKPAPPYRPVAFDARRKRYLCSRHVAGDGAGFSMALYVLEPRSLPARKVEHVGIEVLTPAGRKAIAARAVERAKAAGVEVLPPGRTGEAYDFALTTVEGKKIRARDLRGQVVLIECWTTECVAWMEKMPKLKALYEKHRQDGLEIIGVSLDRDAATVRKVCKQQGLTWPQVLVPGGERTRELWSEAAGMEPVPRVFLMDRAGILRAAWGPDQVEQDVGKLEEEIDKLLERSAGRAAKTGQETLSSGVLHLLSLTHAGSSQATSFRSVVGGRANPNPRRG
ncbi:MAG TPA: sigma-70 family RNA polymerase sigma factor [Gemmataceae bacterium]|jgi:RNA polymerase sigma factor (sigma-70 family)|nr:sigma-70 family RNA polymerase sigma factor [Gemmataceae bacterium]